MSETVAPDPVPSAPEGDDRKFGSRLLGGVIFLAILCVLVVVGFYAVPPEHLSSPQHQPAVRIAAVGDFPVGTSRVQSWGEEVILVVRSAENRFTAVQGVSPVDGCLLDWSGEAQRVVSPCGLQVYDLHGHAVAGLTTEPLRRYGTYVRDGVVYVTKE
jgi:nitrite reductase/ring-hydroxylating ferredoxin subunit